MKIHNPKLLNWSQDVGGFYGITIKESDGSPAYKGINTLTFDRSSFYIGQNVPNTDEVIVSFRGSSGGNTTASNLGTGSGLFSTKVGDDLQFKSLTQGPGIKFNASGSVVRIDSTVEQFYGLTVKQSNGLRRYRNINTLNFEASSFYIEQNNPNTDEATVNFRGDKTTASNLGAGSGLFAQKVGDDLQFKGLVAGANITLTNASTGITIATTREALTASRTYYVRTDGSDSNTGLVNSAGGAFLTIQKGIDTALTIEQNSFTITIQVGAGTYTAGVNLSTPFSGPVQLTGDTTTPTNVLISVTSAQAIAIQGSSVELSIGGFELRTTTAGQCLSVQTAAILRVNGNMRYGACAGAHMFVAYTGSIIVTANYTISGNAVQHHNISFGSFLYCANVTVTLSGTPAFASFYMLCTFLSACEMSANTYSGAATGTRYSVTTNGAVQTNGAGANYFPGNAAGSTATGGQYV